MGDPIYLDNNASTPMPRAVREEIARAANLGNPSSEYVKGRRCRSHEILHNLRLAVASVCGVSLEEFAVVLTGSGSEANNYVLRETVEAYAAANRGRPHVVASAVEHKTSLDCLDQLRRRRFIDLTLVPPDASGQIPPAAVARALRPNTCLVSVMHANNETGAVNDIQTIGQLCHEFTYQGQPCRIPFHTDAVQTFGKTPPRVEPNLDAVSISFHKLHGPSGIGALVIRRELLTAWKFEAQVCGSQNEGLRGGTENVLGAAGALMAMQYTFADRAAKNAKMAECRTEFLRMVAKSFRVQGRAEFEREHAAHMAGGATPPPSIVILTPLGEDAAGPRSTPNTLLLSVVDYTREVCNADLKSYLGRHGVLVSVGSACNTEATKASHVLGDLPAIIKRGTLRISVGDETTVADMRKASLSLRRMTFGHSPPDSDPSFVRPAAELH